MPRGKTIPMLREQLAEEAKRYDILLYDRDGLVHINNRIAEENKLLKSVIETLMEVIRAKHR